MSDDLPHYISLGAGVQSSTMALMAAHGELTPMPKGAIFADTQAEPASVYRWLDWLEERLPFPVHRVTRGSLRDAALRPHVSAKGAVYYKTAIPFHTKGEGGKAGRITHRSCTRDYKIVPILRALRKLAGVPRGCREVRAVQWIGISLDEIQRMKPSRDPWAECRWPLIERRMTRLLCLDWMREHGYPEPPRSACVFCPFRSNKEWRHLKVNDPEGFADAVEFDEEARRVREGYALFRSTPYVHRDLVPLAEADVRSDTDRGQEVFSWMDECEGMCGV